MKTKVSMKRKSTSVSLGGSGLIYEFMVRSDLLNGGGQGALLAVTQRRDGTVEVEVFRADPRVYVRVGDKRYQATKKDGG